MRSIRTRLSSYTLHVRLCPDVFDPSAGSRPSTCAREVGPKREDGNVMSVKARRRVNREYAEGQTGCIAQRTRRRAESTWSDHPQIPRARVSPPRGARERWGGGWRTSASFRATSSRPSPGRGVSRTWAPAHGAAAAPEGARRPRSDTGSVAPSANDGLEPRHDPETVLRQLDASFITTCRRGCGEP